jgi:hypothetical protein
MLEIRSTSISVSETADESELMKQHLKPPSVIDERGVKVAEVPRKRIAF